MGAGCEIPPDAKPANVRAMLQSVVKHGYLPVADAKPARAQLRARVSPVAFPTAP